MLKKQFSQQQKLVVLKSAKELGVKEAASLADVHYTTVYDWRNQLKILGKKAFLEYTSPTAGRGVKKVSESQEKAVLTTWHENPGFGPGQVRNQLRRQGITISTRSVRKVMEADGYQPPRKKSKADKGDRFEARRPLELVQLDILEFFINKLKVFIFLLLDDFSRFILGWRLLTETSTDAIIALVQETIDRYGKMEEILTDRGFVFYSWRGINRFEKFLQMQRIDHTHARPHHPQTLGKVEACNRRIKTELIDQHHFINVHEAESAISNWVEHYNYKRTHQGIGGLLVPAERFHGRAKHVITAVGKGIDITKENCYMGTAIDRSIFNLVLGADGNVILYIMGQSIVLTGGKDVEQIKS
jgi:transposase InsO family protein